MNNRDPKTITPEDFQRLEAKLDRLIAFFNLDATPGRSRRELENMADAAVLKFQRKKPVGRVSNPT